MNDADKKIIAEAVALGLNGSRRGVITWRVVASGIGAIAILLLSFGLTHIDTGIANNTEEIKEVNETTTTIRIEQGKIKQRIDNHLDKHE